MANASHCGSWPLKKSSEISCLNVAISLMSSSGFMLGSSGEMCSDQLLRCHQNVSAPCLDVEAVHPPVCRHLRGTELQAHQPHRRHRRPPQQHTTAPSRLSLLGKVIQGAHGYESSRLWVGYTAHLQFIRWNPQMIMQLPVSSSESGSAPSLGFFG